MFYLEDGREQFYQWDVNRRLVITNDAIDQVHYCNRTDDCSLVVETYEEDGLLMADVPNILLQDKWDIKIYLYANGEYTEQCRTYKVLARTKPTDYVYTETEALKWEELEAEIKADAEANNEAIRAEVRTALNDVGNSLKGTASGTSAVKIDDISPLPHNIDIKLKAANLLTSPFGEIYVANGKTYTFNVKLKDDAAVVNGYYYIFQGIREDGSTTDLLTLWDEHKEASCEFVAGAEEHIKYQILHSDDLKEDMFEYAELKVDVNTVGVKSYGKNLFKYSYSNWYKYVLGSSTRYVMDLYIPCDCVVSMGRREESGTFYIRKYKDNYDGTGENVNVNGYAFATTGKEPTKQAIKKETGYLYRLETTKASWENDYVSWVQVECGTKSGDATEYEPYKEPVEGAVSTYPNTTVVADVPGTAIEATYDRDINKAFAELQNTLISLGANI